MWRAQRPCDLDLFTLKSQISHLSREVQWKVWQMLSFLRPSQPPLPFNLQRDNVAYKLLCLEEFREIHIFLQRTLDWSGCLVFASIRSWGFRGAPHCPPHCSCRHIDPQQVSLDTRWPRAASLVQTVLRAAQREPRVVLVSVRAVWALSEHLRPQTVAKINAPAGAFILSVMFLNISNSKGRLRRKNKFWSCTERRVELQTRRAKWFFVGSGVVFFPLHPLPASSPDHLAPDTYRAKEKIAESRSIIFHIRSATDHEMLGGFAASPVSNEQFRVHLIRGALVC